MSRPKNRRSRLKRLELSMEVCSEAPHHNNEYPSDIIVWINGVEIGTWTSPGDFGGKRGRLTPSWWGDSHSQFGNYAQYLLLRLHYVNPQKPRKVFGVVNGQARRLPVQKRHRRRAA